MSRRLSVGIAHHRLARPFAIARGTREAIELVRVTVEQDGWIGHGEGAPNARYGEFAPAVAAQIEAMAPLIADGIGREELLTAMSSGAARNAIDCALWDLEAKLSGVPVAARFGPQPEALVTAVTVGIASPRAMAERARDIALAHGVQDPPPLLKLKLDAHDVATRVAAVRDAAPGATLIADANESWDMALLERVLPALADARIALLEQPLPAGADAALKGLRAPVPISADESVHVAADIAEIAARYSHVTIKLDKAGGLTGALALAEAAREAGMEVMTGCMLCSSLSVAAAWPLAAQSRFVDLDGPLWLAEDIPDGCQVENGLLRAPHGLKWGIG
ncbi:L-alanine-DL-glutamate epimerase-like enolase superfamily enzyme [Novosphingobium sp. PhB165]|uniref:dipeptide epimerase n=1 Tax=Novosphingobium sp. PhB165 TaxID=2485105 RepID=UPI001050EABE|nr:dipeptide epimerase [Novosphingobium sp. PhB165]TCM15675.1 L-alanine-DL-glutamate epimerase-like enolase superfamily enzyme [Novosphingobium sp. PhB165]